MSRFSRPEDKPLPRLFDNLTNDDMQTLTKALCEHVLGLIQSYEERFEDRIARASNWTRRNNDGQEERISFEEAKHGLPQTDGLALEIPGKHDDDDPAGAAPRTRYILRLAEPPADPNDYSAVRRVYAKWVLVQRRPASANGETDRIVVRYRHVPTMAEAYTDAIRVENGEFT